jgi:hypothetical protein
MIELEVSGKRERIRPGLHICQLYNQRDELTHTTAALLRDGLRGSDKCYFAGSAQRVADLHKLLRAGHLDVEGALASGQLQLCEERDELLREGRFDPYHLLSTHLALVARALNEGWQQVRAVIDMGWLAQEVATPEQLLKYEAASDAVFTFQGRPIVALLQYNYAELPGEVVVELLKLHPIAVVGRFIKRNPYYVNAEDYMVKIIRRGQPGPAGHVGRPGHPGLVGAGAAGAAGQAAGLGAVAERGGTLGRPQAPVASAARDAAS